MSTQTNRQKKLSRQRKDIPQDILHEPDVPVSGRVRPTETHRVTPAAYSFIVTYVLAGYSDDEINDKLREKQFIWEGEPSLSKRTLARVRASDDCVLSRDMLTIEARQIGHNIISEMAASWGRVQRESFRRIEKREYEKVSMNEDLAVVNKATAFFMNLFADGLAERLRGELEEEVEDNDDITKMSADQIAQYLEGIMSSTYTRAVKMIEEQRRAEGKSGPALPAYDAPVAN